MSPIADSLIALIAVLHLCFLVLEMFYWDKALGMKIFGHRPEEARSSRVLAANQGLYNAFLAAGLIWGLIRGASGGEIKFFFLSCVLIAGIYGAATANRKILIVQALPAAVAIALLLLA